jgi:hypothetical protein
MKRYLQAILTIFIVNTPVISQITVPQILAPDSTNMVKIGADNTVNNEIDVDFIKINKRVATKSMSSSERKSLVKPVTGLIIFDTDLNLSFKFDGDDWHQLYFQGRDNVNIKEIKNNEGIDIRLSPLDGLPSDNFGCSVSISSEYAVIGSSQDNIKGKEQQGSAYIFHKVNGIWKEEFKLVALDGEAMDNFGCSVFIWGDYVIVGASGDEIEGKSGQGSAYIFQRTGNNWIQKSKLISPFGRNNDFFGISVAISANYAIIGSPLDDSGGTINQGAAYIFKKINEKWLFESVLYANDASRKDYYGYGFKFGCSVSLSDDFAVIGSYEDDIDTNKHQGSAYIFKRVGTEWIERSKLIANDGARGDYFGWRVSIFNDFVAIGSLRKSSHEYQHQGSVYIFKNQDDSWIQSQKLASVDGVESGCFGYDLAISENYLIISSLARKKSTNQSEQGIVYVYQKSENEWKYIRQIIEPDTGDSDFPVGVKVGIWGNDFLVGSLVNESVCFGQIPFLNRKVESKK